MGLHHALLLHSYCRRAEAATSSWKPYAVRHLGDWWFLVNCCLTKKTSDNEQPCHIAQSWHVCLESHQCTRFWPVRVVPRAGVFSHLSSKGLHFDVNSYFLLGARF